MAERLRVYAEGTSTPVEKSRNEVESFLTKRGAGSIFFMQEPAQFVLGFKLHNLLIRFNVPLPTSGRQDSIQKVRRERMRALLLLIKARFASVDSGITTFEREFMPNVVMDDDGRTMADIGVPRLIEAAKGGQLPKLLPFLGGKG